jgi:hypothetical protein
MSSFDHAATDHTLPDQPQAPATDPVPAAAAVEIVPRGLLWSLAAIPLGMLTSVLIWKLGYIASISSFLIAGLATWLYTQGARAVPRRGLVPLVGVIVAGVVLSFLAIVAADIVEYHGTPEGQALGYPSALDMVAANLFDPKVLGSYGSDLVMFVLFAALGVFGTLRRLMRSRG